MANNILPAPRKDLEPDCTRFIKVRKALLDVQHPLHPMARGEQACWYFAWFDLVGNARYQDSPEMLRGQLLASHSYLMNRWNWSESRTKNFLGYFKEGGLIGTRPQGGGKPSVISIRNYDYYNGYDPA